MKQLDDMRVLVTGAGRGLGYAIARSMAAYSATVIAVSRTESELQDLAATIAADGGKIETRSIDIGDRRQLRHLVDEVNEQYGGVDTIINNAAVLRMKAFVELDENEFDDTIEVNLLAPTRLIRGFLPGMRSRGRGAIINVSSGAATRGFVNETDYCATKYGLEGFSFSLAMELADENISVNLVTPGYSIKPTSITAEEFSQWSPEDQMRYRDPIDMTDAFAFLATQYPKDGGRTGERFNASELSEHARQEGWNVNMLLAK